MSTSHELVPVPGKDWPKLRELFTRNWPEHILGYSILSTYIGWRERNNGKDIRHLKILSLDGDWESDGTFLVIDRYQLFIYSLVADPPQAAGYSSATRLETALGLLDWSRGFKVSSFSARHRQSLVRVVESKGLVREFDSETLIFHLTKEKATELSMEIPEDVVIHPLSDEDVPLANELWPNRHSGSLFFLRRVRKLLPNLGAFKRLPNGKEEIMGWCFTHQAGALGTLQVREEFQGRGLGKLLTTAMAKLFADLGKDTFALVGEYNLGSVKIFTGLGYEVLEKSYWLRTFPMGKSESIWVDDDDTELQD